ncbi:MAG TPA: hypothetical protein VEC93_15360, partial [Anaerolineae bacterium]|nr:hypothetical protein [Anaerolineae bacterium]
MSDFDQTIYSGRGAPGTPGGPQPVKPKRNPLLLIGGIGCALLLCVALVAGIGLYFARDQFDEVLASLGGGTATPVVVDTPTKVIATPSSTPTSEATVEIAPTVEEGTESGVTSNGGDEETATPVSEPEFGAITFALGATEDYQPINPALTFQEGITEVHAIFEYSGMSKEYQWERVWYLDGKEVLRNAQNWSGDEAGVFDYFIDAGNDPLFPGEWVLELYVQDNLLQTGSFTIEGAELAQGDNGEHAADLSPTSTA